MPPTPSPPPSSTPADTGSLLTRIADVFTRMEQGLARIGQGFTDLISKMSGAISKMGNALALFVGASSPVAVIQFNIALRDLQGTIGRVLTPALQRVTEITRALADTFASLSAPVQKLMGGLALGGGLGALFSGIAAAALLLVRTIGRWPLLLASLVGSFVGVMGSMQGAGAVGDLARSVFDRLARIIGAIATAVGPALLRVGGALFAVLGSVLEALAPLIVILADMVGGVLDAFALALGVVAEVIVLVVGAIKQLTHALFELWNELRESLGLKRIDALDAGSKVQKNASVGAGVRPASVGDLQGFINSAYASSFGSAILKHDPREAERKAQKQRDDMISELKQFNLRAGQISGGGPAPAAAAAGSGSKESMMAGAFPLAYFAAQRVSKLFK